MQYSINASYLMRQVEKNKFQNVKAIEGMEDHIGKNICKDQEGSK